MQPTKYEISPNSNRGPSHQIWDDCPTLQMIDDPSFGFHHWDDFLGFQIPASTMGTGTAPYKTLVGTGCSLACVSGQGGILRFTQDGTDNDEVGLELGNGVGGPFSLTANSGPKLWCEVRFRVSQVSAAMSLFLGLATAGAAATTDLLIDDSDALVTSSTNLVGFRTLGSATVMHTCLQNGAAERSSRNYLNGLSSAQTLAASTWYKVGFKYDRDGVDGGIGTPRKLRYYVNGVEVDYVSDDSIATFPTGDALTLALLTKASGANAYNIEVDWVRAAQIAPES